MFVIRAFCSLCNWFLAVVAQPNEVSGSNAVTMLTAQSTRERSMNERLGRSIIDTPMCFSHNTAELPQHTFWLAIRFWPANHGPFHPHVVTT